MLQLDTVDLQKIRQELYLGKGYVVIRAAVPPTTINHIRAFWQNQDKFTYKARFNKYTDIHLNGPDHSVRNQHQLIHYNFFWNQPRDSVTYNLAWKLQTFRNKIEGQPIDWGFLPHYRMPGEQKNIRYISSYRLVFTALGKPVPLHCDWDLDHSKIQISLMLTSFGLDYSGGGFLINNQFRGGEAVNISEKEKLQAGDLLLFRYAHKHGVGAVQSNSGGSGFGRMLMPIEVVNLEEKSFFGRWKKHLGIVGLKTAAKIKRTKPDFQKVISSKKRLIRGQGESLYYDTEIAQLMDIAIKAGISPAHVYLHRGLWGRFRMFQDWQMEVLKKHGILPKHHFLDIGCGILRLGMPLIQFLETDRYCGIDPVESYIQVGERYLKELIKTKKKYQLLVDENFAFNKFNRRFDFAMAQSVFTHLSFAQIEQCFGSLKKVMKPGSKFIFTILLNKNEEQNVLYIEDRPLTKSSHSGLDFYYKLARQFEFEFKFLGKENHPTQQVCLAIF